MKEYVALWHIGNVTRGEIIMLSDEEAEKLLKKGAIRPIGNKAGAEKAAEPKPAEEPETEELEAPEEGAEIEDGDGTEAEDESEADEEPEAPEIDALDAIGDAEPEPEPEPVKPARKSRKTSKKEG